MNILLQYRTRGDSEWHSTLLTPAEYFDLEKDELPEIDSVPRHNHACDYLSLQVEDLAETKIILQDIQCDTIRTIKEKFWLNGRNRLIERIDGGIAPYREVIICSEVQSHPNRLEVIRINAESNFMVVTSHVIIETFDDGSQHEIQLFDQAADS